jgi:hypothetical protein
MSDETVEEVSSGAKLLMISDIEGCVPNFFSTPQNTSLCELETYTKTLKGFLESNKKNEIVFLGDYFDKGPGVVTSICGIAYLHKTYPNRVHITEGGNLIDCGGKLLVPTADIDTAKLHWNSVVSTESEKYMYIDIKSVYLSATLEYF